MKARLRKWYKRRKKKGQSETFRKVMRYVEPKKFYEDNLFSVESGEADTWRVCWVAEKVLLLAGLAAAINNIWWTLPILFFPVSISWLYRAAVEGKVGTGYPYIEVGDVMGISLFGWITAFISLVWFLNVI